MKRHVVFAIDVEPDGRKSVADDPWSGLDTTLQELSKLRSQIEKVTQAPSRFNFFFRFDPQIERMGGRRDWVVHARPALIPWLQQHGDFAGIHPHFWRWSEPRQHWFTDLADPVWCAHCVHETVEGYRSIFGQTPIACRFGDACLSNDLIPVMRKEGIRYDLTVEPGVPGHPIYDDPHASAWVPDYLCAPRAPYHPSEEDFLAPESRAIRATERQLWLVPMTSTAPVVWTRSPRFPFLQKVSVPPNLVMNPRRLWRHLSAEIERVCAEPLVFVLRSGDLNNPVFLRNFKFIAERLAKHPGLKQCRFMPVDEAVESFAKAQTQHHG